MSTDLDEIADLLAKVKDFCASVRRGPSLGIRDTEGRPVDDVLLLGVPTMEMMCEAVHSEIMFDAAIRSSAAPERERMLTECAHRLDVALERLRSLLYQARASKSAFELSVQIGRITAARKARSDTANQAKRDDADSRTRQIAALWNHEREQHPAWSADKIGQEVRAKAKVAQRTLERHLAQAREQGLIHPSK